MVECERIRLSVSCRSLIPGRFVRAVRMRLYDWYRCKGDRHMDWKATLMAAFVMFAVTACNLPAAQPTTAPPVPTETVEQAATAEPAETSTEPPAATDTAPPPATPAPTVEEPERVSFETGATSATVEGEVEACGTDEYLIYVLAGQEMTIVLATVAQNLSLTVEAPDGTELPSTVGEGNEWVSVVPET